MTDTDSTAAYRDLLTICEHAHCRVVTHLVRHVADHEPSVSLAAGHYTLACGIGPWQLAQQHRALEIPPDGIALWWQAEAADLTSSASTHQAGIICQFHLADGVDREAPRHAWPASVVHHVSEGANLLTAIGHEWRRLDPWSDPRTRYLLCLVLSAALRAGQPNTTTGCLSAEQLQRLHDYLDSQLARRPSATAIARAVGLNAAYLSRRVRATTGVSLKRYVLELRMRRISSLLCHTDAPLSELAQQHGYTDMGLFSRQFRSVFGASPATWRRRARLASLPPPIDRPPA